MTTIAIIDASTDETSDEGAGVTTLGGVSAIEFDALRLGHCAICASGLQDEEAVYIYLLNHSRTAWTPVYEGGEPKTLTATSPQCNLVPGGIYGVYKEETQAPVEVFGIINVQNVG